jgi:hypothetical protein
LEKQEKVLGTLQKEEEVVESWEKNGKVSGPLHNIPDEEL